MIKLTKKIYDEMIAHAKKDYPHEACGFVVGINSTAAYYIPMENVDHSTVTYSIDPKQQMKVFKRINEDKMELLGIFHSHVASSASPSQTDKRMAFYPEVSYLIVSLSDMHKPDLKSYKINGDDVTAEEIQIQ